MNTALVVLIAITGISIVAFTIIWTWFRMQRIGRKNEQRWHKTAFWWLLGFVVLMFITTLIVYFTT